MGKGEQAKQLKTTDVGEELERKSIKKRKNERHLSQNLRNTTKVFTTPQTGKGHNYQYSFSLGLYRHFLKIVDICF